MAGLAGISSATLSQIPGMPAPLGKTPNFDDPAVDGSTRPEVIAVGAIPAGLTVLCCAMRVYTRVWVSKSAGWDDVWIVIATICALAYTGVVIASAAILVDVHMWNISVETVIKYLPLLRAIGYICFVPTLLTAKIALASFFLRLFSIKRLLRVAIWAIIAWSVFVSFFALFWSIGRCAPVGLAYVSCSGKTTVPCLVAAALNIATDIMLLAIPLWGIFPLQMHRHRKIAVSLIFLTGLSAVLASCLGLYYRIVQKNSLDVTWNFAAVNILSMFEIDTTIIVACLPSFPALSDGKLTPLLTLIESTADLGRQALLAAKVDSIFSRRSRSRNSSRKDSKISPDLSESSKITVFSEIHQMEEGRGEIIQIQDHIAPFTSPSMPTYSKQELGQTGL